VSASSGWEFGGGFAAWMKETGSEVKTVRLDEFGFIVSLQACTVAEGSADSESEDLHRYSRFSVSLN
jgi:hypothetical protein